MNNLRGMRRQELQDSERTSFQNFPLVLLLEASMGAHSAVSWITASLNVRFVYNIASTQRERRPVQEGSGLLCPTQTHRQGVSLGSRATAWYQVAGKEA